MHRKSYIHVSYATFSFKERGCLKISRSAPICGTGSSSPREQLNENTGFVDASMIYGSSTKDLHKFRDGRTGFLKMDRFNEMMVLPFDHSKCTAAATCKATFVAGDIRANLFIGLSSLHIMFAREHNRYIVNHIFLKIQWLLICYSKVSMVQWYWACPRRPSRLVQTPLEAKDFA